VQLNLTNIAPLAVPLTKNGAPVPGKWLMQPLLKVYGQKVKELDGSESNQEFDESAQNQKFISKYFLIPANTTADDVLTFTIPEALEEGYYKLSAVLSAVTEFPTLVALSGEWGLAGVPENPGDTRRVCHQATLHGLLEAFLDIIVQVALLQHAAGGALPQARRYTHMHGLHSWLC
jgi:hypothetical protein